MPRDRLRVAKGAGGFDLRDQKRGNKAHEGDKNENRQAVFSERVKKAADGRARYEGELHVGGIPGNGVGKMFRGNEFGNDRMAGRSVEGVGDANDKKE